MCGVDFEMGPKYSQQKNNFLSQHSYIGQYKFKPFKLVLDSTQCQETSPKPRSGHRIVCNDFNMFSFGGYNPSLSSTEEADMQSDIIWSQSKPLFKELWQYNISTKSWKKLNALNIPDTLASNAVILSGHVLLVYGGTGAPFGVTSSNDLYICNLKNSLVESNFEMIEASGVRPQPQYGQAILLIDNYLYTIGGTTGYEYSCDVHRLNLKNGVWEVVYLCSGSCYEPAGRYRHEIAYDEDRIYVLGGGTSEEAFDFKTVFAFNLSNNKWEIIETLPDNNTVETYPTPRRCHASVQHEHYAYIIGGFSGRMILKDIWRLDLKKFVWNKFLNFYLDLGAYFHSSCITPSGKLITFGGIVPTETSSTRTSNVYSAWLCIPKLSDICWEAVMYYHPNLDCLTEKELISLGLPYKYIRKLDPKK